MKNLTLRVPLWKAAELPRDVDQSSHAVSVRVFSVAIAGAAATSIRIVVVVVITNEVVAALRGHWRGVDLVFGKDVCAQSSRRTLAAVK
jgi:hypothetical protein